MGSFKKKRSLTPDVLKVSLRGQSGLNSRVKGLAAERQIVKGQGDRAQVLKR